MMIDVEAEHRRLVEIFDQTAAMLEWPDDLLFRAEETRSGWSPAQHLHHLWLSSSMSLHAAAMLHRGHDAVVQEGAANERGRIVLDDGRFPRGVMQAPQNVQPPDDPSRETLEETLGRGRAKLEQVAGIVSDLPDVSGRLPHPRLGVLDASEWLRFTRVHAEHHLEIIHEIEASAS